MKEIHFAYKFEIKPTPEQKVLLDKHFGCCRWVYNHFLAKSKEQYKLTKTKPTKKENQDMLPVLKEVKETEWLKEVYSQSLQVALINLENAFDKFFKGEAKYPKFKSKRDRNSFTAPQGVEIKGNYIRIPMFKRKWKKGVKIIAHRKIEGKIGSCTFSRTPTGRYYVSISTVKQYQPLEQTGQICGIDLGLKTFLVTSDGDSFKNHKFLKKYEKKLAKAQRNLSRKKKGSKSFEKQKRKVALIHEKVANTRKDMLHKTSLRLIQDYDVIFVEDLNIKGMIKNRKLAKHIADASWGTFLRYLDYKAKWNDRQIVPINRFFPSSKTCHKCGWIKQDLTLKDRVWECGGCHSILDRDLNASINILHEGLKLISSGTGDYTGGEPNKTSSGKHNSVKPEARLSLADG